MPYMQRRRVAVCEESELKRYESVLIPPKALVLSGGFVFFRLRRPAVIQSAAKNLMVASRKSTRKFVRKM